MLDGDAAETKVFEILRSGDKESVIQEKLTEVLAIIEKLGLILKNIRCDEVRHIAAALKTNKTLHTLSILYNGIGNEGARYIAKILKFNTNLHTLKIDGNKIGDEGARYIAEALKSNNTLNILSFFNNMIGDEGARYIAEALKSNNTLHTLYINNNRIGDEGVKRIAEALKSNNTLHTLYISNNRIGDEGVKHIAEALRSNNTLHALHIDDNKIEDEGAKHIADSLKTNKTLRILNLCNHDKGKEGLVNFMYPNDNKIGNEGIKHIIEMLKSNNALYTLDLSYSQIKRMGSVLILLNTLKFHNISIKNFELDFTVGFELDFNQKQQFQNIFQQNKEIATTISDLVGKNAASSTPLFNDDVVEIIKARSMQEYYGNFFQYMGVCKNIYQNNSNAEISSCPPEILYQIFVIYAEWHFESKYGITPTVCRVTLPLVLEKMSHEIAGASAPSR